MADSPTKLPHTSTPTSDAPTHSPISTSRRRLTGAGLGVSAIFTLASRPVLAAQCTSASSAASGNLSQHGTPTQCTGRTPGYWKNPESRGSGKLWPDGYEQGTCSGGGCSSSPENWVGGTAFHPEFFGSKFKIGDQSLSMNQVMILNNSTYLGITDEHNLGSHIVAALLNAASGKTDGVLTIATVKAMWSECQTKGYFEPMAGVQWTPAQVVAYLKTTMTL